MSTVPRLYTPKQAIFTLFFYQNFVSCDKTVEKPKINNNSNNNNNDNNNNNNNNNKIIIVIRI